MSDEHKKKCCREFLTLDDVRDYVADHETSEGTFALFNVEFSDEEIFSSMKSAAREYNGISPFIGVAHPDRLPTGSNMFFDGAAYFLYLRKLQTEQREDIPYKAGGVDIDIAARRVQHFQKSSDMFHQRFLEVAKSWKRHVNQNMGFGPVGGHNAFPSRGSWGFYD